MKRNEIEEVNVNASERRQKLKLFWVKDYAKVVKAEHDTLKRAYELACAFLAEITQDNVCDYKDFFYQEAKKNRM